MDPDRGGAAGGAASAEVEVCVCVCVCIRSWESELFDSASDCSSSSGLDLDATLLICEYTVTLTLSDDDWDCYAAGCRMLNNTMDRDVAICCLSRRTNFELSRQRARTMMN